MFESKEINEQTLDEIAAWLIKTRLASLNQNC